MSNPYDETKQNKNVISEVKLQDKSSFPLKPPQVTAYVLVPPTTPPAS